jgi:hypothetical protein
MDLDGLEGNIVKVDQGMLSEGFRVESKVVVRVDEVRKAKMDGSLEIDKITFFSNYDRLGTRISNIILKFDKELDNVYRQIRLGAELVEHT